MKHKDRTPLERKMLIEQEAMVNEDFWTDEEKWVRILTSDPAAKGNNSVLGIAETGLQKPIPESMWSQALMDTAHKSVSSILTDKRGLQRHDEYTKREGLTVPAAKAFLPGLLPELTKLTPDDMKEALEAASAGRSASVLACGLRALTDGRDGTNAIVNKPDSVEKDRCIAIMDWIMRYPCLLIEEVFTSILKSHTGGKESLSMERTVPQSVLVVKDKIIPLMRAMDDLKKDVREAIKNPKPNTGVEYKKAKELRIIKLMNDASSWGPWKNLASMYTSAKAQGASPAFCAILLATIELFMTKYMVLHSSMQPPTEEKRKGKKDKRKEATLARVTEERTQDWNLKLERYLP
jgi:hypothetical protein